METVSMSARLNGSGSCCLSQAMYEGESSKPKGGETTCVGFSRAALRSVSVVYCSTGKRARKSNVD